MSPVPVSEANAPPWIEGRRAEDTGGARGVDRLLARELRVLLRSSASCTGPRRDPSPSCPSCPRRAPWPYRCRPTRPCRRPACPLRAAAADHPARSLFVRVEVSSSDARSMFGAESSTGICWSSSPDAEVDGERAAEVREHAALERREQRHRVAARLRRRRDEERRLADADANLRARRDRDDRRAALRGELGERRRLAVRRPSRRPCRGANVEREVVAVRRDEREVRRRRALDRELDARRGADASSTGSASPCACATRPASARRSRCDQAAERDPVVAARQHARAERVAPGLLAGPWVS